MFGRLGLLEMAVIAFIALILIGPEKAPGLGRAVAKGIKGYKKINKEIKESVDITNIIEDKK